ncbi:MAG: alpha/beta fold hydrolase [Qingshengfaniella sp.]
MTIAPTVSDIDAQVARFQAAFPRTVEPDSGLAYRRAAVPAGRSVLLCPGASGTSEFFCLVAAPLVAAGLDPILVDYPGDVPPETLAERFAVLTAALGSVRPIGIGCSYSAYWLQLPVAARGLAGRILCNGFVEAADLLPNPLFDHAAIAATGADQLRREWADRARPNQGTDLGRLLLCAMEDWLPARDLKGRLMAVSASQQITGGQDGAVAVVDCADDPIVGAAARLRFRQAWPGARHVTTEGGHYPYVTAPDVFVDTIKALVEAMP